MEKSILLLSTADWDNPFWTNKQRMAVLFAEHGYRVVYVDSLGLRKPSLHSGDIKRIIKRLLKSIPVPRKVYKNIWRISPFVIPFHSINFIRKLNKYILLLTIKWNFFILGIKKPIIVSYTPIASDICADLKKSAVIYHCVDDLGASPGIDETVIREAEKKLAGVTDLCFVTSKKLLTMLSSVFRQVEYDPNVCDLSLFQTAREPSAEPEELQAIPHPRLIFVGALSQYKVDFVMIRQVAEKLPHVHWVLIGAIGEGQPGTQRPPEGDNIHILGPRPYEALPSYLGHCDIAVLPATRNDYTAAMFPMKFFEYLASGLPVVSTRLPALEDFEDLYFPADSAEEFVLHIERMLAGERKDADAIEATCRFHTWEARFARMEKRIREVVASRQS